MRMKRFLSLMLAIAMLASLTISASAATKLYYAQDFDYANVDVALADITRFTTGSGLAGAKTTGANMSYKSGTVAALSATQSTLTTESGINWFTFNTQTTTENGTLYIVPDSTWKYTTNQNETYIISYDMKVNPQGSAKETYRYTTFWESDDAATIVEQRVFNHNRPSADSTDVTLYTYKDFYDNNSGPSMSITSNTAHKLAVGYTYNTETAPLKTTKAVNGSVQNTITHACLISGSTIQNNLAGIGFAYDYNLGSSIANIKMYTIGNDDVFGVSRIGSGEVATTTTAVPIKFSQPVYAASFVPANVTVSKTNASGTTALTYDTDFTVTGLTEVVGNVGGEVYSTATVNFLTALEEASTYTITFPTAIKNELGTALAAANATVSFTTPSPEIVVGNKIITKAWGTASATEVNNFAANGVYGVSMDIENTTDAAKNIAVIYAVYADGKLEDVVYASDSIAATSTATIGAGVNLSADVTAVKAFIWDGISSMKPQADHAEWTIAE